MAYTPKRNYIYNPPSARKLNKLRYSAGNYPPYMDDEVDMWTDWQPPYPPLRPDFTEAQMTIMRNFIVFSSNNDLVEEIKLWSNAYSPDPIIDQAKNTTELYNTLYQYWSTNKYLMFIVMDYFDWFTETEYPKLNDGGRTLLRMVDEWHWNVPLLIRVKNQLLIIRYPILCRRPEVYDIDYFYEAMEFYLGDYPGWELSGQPMVSEATIIPRAEFNSAVRLST